MRKRIGDFLMEKGLINSAQRDEILDYSRKKAVRFGEAGLALGFYKQDQLVRVFGTNAESDFFYLDPSYFPSVTRDFLKIQQILTFGALPLGLGTEHGIFRRGKCLNLGLLNPKRREASNEIKSLICTSENEIVGIKVFLILADQFLAVLRDSYQITESDILRLQKEMSLTLDPVLEMYLEDESS